MYLTGAETVCIYVSLVSLLSTNAGYAWALGSCTLDLGDVGDRTYTEMCCVPPGQQTLTCKASDGFGWTNIFVEINGHRFCNDFTGHKAMRTIDVAGELCLIYYTINKIF